MYGNRFFIKNYFLYLKYMNFELLIIAIIFFVFLYKIYDKIKKNRSNMHIVLEGIHKIQNEHANILDKLAQLKMQIDKQLIKRKILIIGCGRSGTSYTTKIFKRVGVNLGHEIDGEDGIVSWLMTVQGDHRPWGPSRSDYNFEYILHQVRNPINVISSAQTFNERSWKFIAQYIPIKRTDSLTIKCAKYWYFWNMLAEKRALFTYKIENIDNELPGILQIIKLGKYDDSVKEQSKKTNSRQYEIISLNSVKKEDEELYKNIVTLAEKYGYTKSELQLK